MSDERAPTCTGPTDEFSTLSGVHSSSEIFAWITSAAAAAVDNCTYSGGFMCGARTLLFGK